MAVIALNIHSQADRVRATVVLRSLTDIGGDKMYYTLVLTLAATTASQVVSIKDEPRFVAVDAVQLSQALPTIERVLRQRPASCFRVFFGIWNGKTRVDFSVRRDLSPKLRKQCGLTTGYVLDSNGRVIRKIFSHPRLNWDVIDSQ